MLESSKSNVRVRWSSWGSQDLHGLRWFCLANVFYWQGLGVQVDSSMYALLKPGPLPADNCPWVAGGSATKGDSVQGSETVLDGLDSES